MSYHLTAVSGNEKTGKIAVSTSTAKTCPDACPMKARGCYAAGGPLNLHWRKITNGERGSAWDAFLASIAALPVGSKFRHNQAGDLPGINNRLDHAALAQLAGVVESRQLKAWTYTHKPLTPKNTASILDANRRGFTINASADNLAEADVCHRTGIPTVVVLPENAPEKLFTPEGRKVVVCPVQTGKALNCEACMLCHKQRSVIIGFRAHGMHKKHVSAAVV